MLCSAMFTICGRTERIDLRRMRGTCDGDSATEPGVARRQVTFFCFCKKKVTKEKQPGEVGKRSAPSGFPTFRKRIGPRKQLGWRRRHLFQGDRIAPSSNSFRGNPRPFSKMLARQHGNSRARCFVAMAYSAAHAL
jgi:hypothetical protein